MNQRHQNHRDQGLTNYAVSCCNCDWPGETVTAPTPAAAKTDAFPSHIKYAKQFGNCPGDNFRTISGNGSIEDV